MILERQHHKIFVKDATPEQWDLVKKATRVWVEDRSAVSGSGYFCINLYNNKERSFPSGFMARVEKRLLKESVSYTIDDKRAWPARAHKLKRRTSPDELMTHQIDGLDAIKKEPVGFFSAATASGKSEVIYETIANYGVTTLIVVPKTHLKKQIMDELKSIFGDKAVTDKFLRKDEEFSLKKLIEKTEEKAKVIGGGYSYADAGEHGKDVSGSSRPKPIGSAYLSDNGDEPGQKLIKRKVIGGSYSGDQTTVELDPEKKRYLEKLNARIKKQKEKLKELQEKQRKKALDPKAKPITVVCYHSLKNIADVYLNKIQMVLIDEGHSSSTASIRENLLRMPNAAYRYAFSATPWRDKPHEKRLLESAMGERVIFEYTAKQAIADKVISNVAYEQLEPGTPEQYLRDMRQPREILERGIIFNSVRNKVLVKKAKDLYERGENVLIFVDEISHLEVLEERFKAKGIQPLIVHGQQSKLLNQQNIQKITKCETGLVTIATMSIGEGINLVNVSTVFLASWGKSSIWFLQRIGRGLRKSANKTILKVFDFKDWFHPTLLRHSLSRQRIFDKIFGKRLLPNY